MQQRISKIVLSTDLGGKIATNVLLLKWPLSHNGWQPSESIEPGSKEGDFSKLMSSLQSRVVFSKCVLLIACKDLKVEK